MTISRLDDITMDEVRLTTPVSDTDLARLKLGDVVYLAGILYTAREGVYRKVVDEGRGLPPSVLALSNVNFHCSPAASVCADGTYAVEVEGDRAGRSLFALANREINARLREVYRDLPPFAMGRFGEQTSCEEEIV